MTPSSSSPEPAAWGRPLAPADYNVESLELAPRLLNKVVVTADGRAGRIIEVEAYRGREDAASHAFRGRTRRNQAMFTAPGHLYVYFTYGVHWCANVVARADEGDAQAVLLRALDPVGGLETMRAARWRAQRRQVDRDLCRGPGRLCQALGIDGASDGINLAGPRPLLWVADDGTAPPSEPGVGPRVGISVATEHPWRFFVAGHPGVSGYRQPVATQVRSRKSAARAGDAGSVLGRPRKRSSR